MEPNRVVGIDFSAAKSDAGWRTWIAEGTVTEERLEIDCLADAASRLGCDPSRERTLDALVEHLTGFDGPTVVGLDFPFSLPAELVGDDWHAFVEGTEQSSETPETPGTWGSLGEIASPRELYETAKSHADENSHHLRRETDRENGGQEPTGFRIKTQTYYGISRVLRGIHENVSVAPFDDTEGEGTVVVEAYPAALFESIEGATRTGYKRDTRAEIEARRKNVAALEETGISLGNHREFAIATDDALDAVAAAVAALRAAKRDFETDGDTADSVEGYIYA